MPVSDAELTSLAHSHDIISIGVLADEMRRTLHGAKTTFVRVASVDVASGAPVARSPAAGELRIGGVPASRAAAVARVREVAAAAAGVAVTGFSLADLEALAARDGVTLRALLPRRMNPAAPTTGYDDVKHVALARLVVDNVPSIQVDWSLYGPKLAQVALTVGADDVDAVSAEDDMTDGRRRAPLEEIRRNIVAAGLEPVERNGRFEIQS